MAPRIPTLISCLAGIVYEQVEDDMYGLSRKVKDGEFRDQRFRITAH